MSSINSSGSMKLDLVEGAEADCVFDNNESYTMYDINKIYGKDVEIRSHGYMSTMIKKYMRVTGNLISHCFLVCPKFCPGSGVNVPQGFVGMKKTNGKFTCKLRPGVHLLNANTEKVELMDLRSQAHSLPHQTVLSRDGVSFSIDALINFKIVCPEKANYKVKEIRKLVTNVAEAALKFTIGKNRFSDVLTHRDTVNQEIMKFMEVRLEDVGIEVDLVETQSLVLSSHLQLAMAMVIESEKKAEGKIIQAYGDLESSKILVEAAENMKSESGSNGLGLAMELHRFELLSQISAHDNRTIVIPNDLLSNLSSLIRKG